MSYTIEKENNTAKITLTIETALVEEGMKRAAQRMSEQSAIPGFRPGKATYEAVKQRVGEMALLEASAEELIRAAFVEAMLKEDLETVGQPHFHTEVLAPGNDIIVTAEVALYPHVIKLADYKSMTVTKEDPKATPELIEGAKRDLQMMRTKEIRKEKGSTLEKGDKTVVNLVMKQGGVVLEGGEGKNHGIYTGEAHYIPGLVEKLLGAKEEEVKSFTLPFPETHYQKHLAGKDVDFDVTINEIYKLEAPEIDDAFAKTLGLNTAKELEDKIAENITAERTHDESLRQDKAILDAISAKSTFEEIPELLVNQELNKMVMELEHTIKDRGMELDEYLKSIGKSISELKLEFTKGALERIKASLVLKSIIESEKITVSEETLDKELDRIAEGYKENAEVKKQIYSPEYRAYIEMQLKNKAALEYLKGIMVK